MARLSLLLFGPFHATLDEHPVTGFDSNKARALLAYLAIEADRLHNRDELIGLFWPDHSDAAARASLRQALANLRRILGDRDTATAFISNTSDGIQFQRASDHFIDAMLFSDLLADCKTHMHRRLDTCMSCAYRLREAVGLYRGDFLAQFLHSGSEAFEEWALVKREHWHHAALQALYQLGEYHARRSEYDQAQHNAERQLELEPWREEAHRQLMRALAATGQRSAALAQYETCRRILARELGSEPARETRALFEQIKAGDLKRANQRHNLPAALTPLIGRRHELDEIAGLLETPICRLLTLAGPGGIGKTRLALQAAAEHLGMFADGVWLVELASLTDPALVPQTVAAALDLREQSARPLQDLLVDFLNSREVLLVLDNCEYLADACARLAEHLLRACPQLTILATSREVLNIAGEVVFRVPALTTPDLNHPTHGVKVVDYEAVQLFAERAVSTLTDFAVTSDNAPAIAQICYHLDGIPLAIELAAARVRNLKVEQIAQRLSNRFRLLTGGDRTALPRHQTLRAMIDWSHNLLTEPECILFRRLSVFAGGWSIEAAEAVCSDDAVASADMLDLLLHLVNKSLILLDERSDETRYRMLETIREYAHDRLLESDEADTMQERHLAFFLQFAEKGEPGPQTDELPPWCSRLESELDNLRTALAWSLTNNVGSGLRLAGVMGYFSVKSLHDREGLDWLRKFLALPEMSSHTPERAKALLWAGVIQYYEATGDQVDPQSLLQQSRLWLEESLAIYQEFLYPPGVADSLYELGRVMSDEGNLEVARELLADSMRTSQEAGDKIRTARALNVLGWIAEVQGDRTQARRLTEESLRIYNESGYRSAAHWPLANLGTIALEEGDLTSARPYLEECLALCLKYNNKPNAAWFLDGLAEVAAWQGRYDQARAYFERGMAFKQEAGYGLGPGFRGLALVAYLQGDYGQADELYRKSLKLLKGYKLEFPYPLEGLASVAAKQGMAKRAITIFGAASALREAIGNPPPPIYQADNERGITTARAQLDEDAFTAAWSAGRAMTPEQAIEYALASADETS